MNNIMVKPFRLEFDDTGGYECMSSAYIIYDANHRFVCKVDVNDYIDSVDWKETHAENEEARKIATVILEALNEKI